MRRRETKSRMEEERPDQQIDKNDLKAHCMTHAGVCKKAAR